MGRGVGRLRGPGGPGAHLELVLWNHVVVSQSVQQREGAVYRHSDLGAVQSQQAAQRPIPASHCFHTDRAPAPPAGLCELATPFLSTFGCLGTIPEAPVSQYTYSPAGERRRLPCSTSLLYFQPEKSRGYYSPWSQSGPAFCRLGTETSCGIQGSCPGWGWDGGNRKVAPLVFLQRVLFMGKTRMGWEDSSVDYLPAPASLGT